MTRKRESALENLARVRKELQAIAAGASEPLNRIDTAQAVIDEAESLGGPDARVEAATMTARLGAIREDVLGLQRDASDLLTVLDGMDTHINRLIDTVRRENHGGR